MFFPSDLDRWGHHQVPDGIYAGHPVVLGALDHVANPRALEGDPAGRGVRGVGFTPQPYPKPDSQTLFHPETTWALSLSAHHFWAGTRPQRLDPVQISRTEPPTSEYFMGKSSSLRTRGVSRTKEMVLWGAWV